jgi:hypothetical protein
MEISTAGELREYLATIPADTPIVLAADVAGTMHSPLLDASAGMYAAANQPYSDQKEPFGKVFLTPEQLADALENEPHAGWSAEEDGAPEGAVWSCVLRPRV